MLSAKLAVPTVLAVFAVAFAMKSGGIAEPQATPAAAPAPTPYSADHARITSGDDSAREPAPTF